MTGETAFTHAQQIGVWDYRKQESEVDEAFNKAFLEGSSRIAREILSAYDVSSIRTIADIGGGYGGLLAAILKDSPSLSGLLFDQPHVIAKSAARLKDSGLSERCRAVGGDFLVHVPEGADLYLLKNVIHDWNDAQSERILKNCRLALREKGKLILIERIMPERAREEPLTVMQDLRMLISNGGRERGESEFRALFEAAGLKLTRVIPLPSGLNIIEAICITNR
jgi:SAM-dependent methyltransferase